MTVVISGFPWIVFPCAVMIPAVVIAISIIIFFTLSRRHSMRVAFFALVVLVSSLIVRIIIPAVAMIF